MEEEMEKKEGLTTREAMCVLAFYLSGVIADWGYFIALARLEDSLWLLIGSVIFGWALALLWPLHATVEFWSWLLGG